MKNKQLIEYKSEEISDTIFYKILSQWIIHWEAIVFLLVITIKMLTYGRVISPEYFDSIYLKKPIIASVLPIVGISYLFKNTGKIIYLFVLDLIISVILFIDTLYYRYFTDIISIGTIKSGILLKDMYDSIASLLRVKDFLYFSDLLLLIPAVMIIKRIRSGEMKLKARLAVFTFMIIFGIVLNGNYIYKLSISQPRLISTMYNKLYVAKYLGNFNFHLLDLYNSVTSKLSVMTGTPSNKKEEIYSFLSEKNKQSSKVLSGIGIDKNLIVIQVEALQQFVINNKINGKEITPNLNRWIRKSLYFDNIFHQVAVGNTSDAEFMMNNSLYPANTGAVYYKYSDKKLNSLPHLLNDKGYYTAALHGYIQSFWNRNIMYRTEGFKDFYSLETFNFDEKIGLGLSDKAFFSQSAEKLKSFNKPFYAFMITLSSHHPYDDIQDTEQLNVGKYENSILGNYLKSICYTDAQLGMFLDKLEESGMLDQSIVVIYGDHGAIPREDSKLLGDFLGINNMNDIKWLKLQKVPLIMHFPEDKNRGVRHLQGGQMDIHPTISNIYNVSNDVMFGSDLLNSNGNTVIFRNGSFASKNVYYDSVKDTYYNLVTEDKIQENQKLKEMKYQVLNQLGYSDDLLNYNLIEELIQK